MVADVVTDMKKKAERVPDPVASRRYSGKFLVRVPPDIHRRTESLRPGRLQGSLFL